MLIGLRCSRPYVLKSKIISSDTGRRKPRLRRHRDMATRRSAACATTCRDVAAQPVIVCQFVCACEAASARPVATCAATAGRLVLLDPGRESRRTGGGVRPPSRPPPASRCRGGADARLTRECVARGGGAARGAGWPGARAHAASPVRAAPERRPVGRQPRGVPAH